MNVMRKLKGATATPTLPAEPAQDELAGAITDAMRGMHELREKNEELTQRVDELERERVLLESELACTKAMLASERSERRHYHSLSNEIITRLDIVGRTVDDVVRSAQAEIARQTAEPAALPTLTLPEFLVKPNGAASVEQAAVES